MVLPYEVLKTALKTAWEECMFLVWYAGIIFIASLIGITFLAGVQVLTHSPLTVDERDTPLAPGD